MRHLRLLLPAFAILGLLVFALPSGNADPAAGWSLESRVPASTLAMVSFEEVGSWEKRFNETSIGQLMQDEEMQAFFEPVSKFFEEQLGNASAGPLGEVPPIFMELLKQMQGLQGQLAFALIDVDMEQGMPDMALSLDFGTNLGDFVTFLGRLKSEMGEDGKAIQQFDRDGRTWWQVDTGGPVISATTVDTTFVIAMNPDTLQGIIGGEPAASLGESSAFSYCQKRAGGDDLAMFIYANLESVLAKFGDEMPREMSMMANTLGLDTVKGAAYGIAYHGKSYEESLLLHTPGAQHGLAALDLAPAAEPTFLKHVPANAFYYSESNLQFDKLVASLRTLLGNVDPDIVREMDKGLAEVREVLGMDIEKDVLSQFANGMGIYASLPQGGGLYPEVVISAPVKEGFSAMFQKLMANLAGVVSEEGDALMSTRSMAYAGQTMHIVDLQFTRSDDPLPFTPTWAVVDGRMFATLVPYTMKELLLRLQSTERSTGPQGLASQADFQELLADRPANVGSYEYLDLQGIMAMLYDTAVPLAQTLVKPNVMGDLPIKLDFAKLPPASKVRKYFSSMMSFSSWSKDGIEITMRAPLPVIAVAIVAVGAGVSYFMAMNSRSSAMVDMPMIAPGRDGGMRDAALKREMAVLTGEEHRRFVELYILEHGKMPVSLEDLVKSQIRRQLDKDPWGNDYRLEVRDAARRAFVIRSPGPDGSFGTGDDIAVGGN